MVTRNPDEIELRQEDAHRMFGWLRDNHEVLSLGVSLGMLIIWGTYLQVFLIRHRRQTRAKIVINCGAGSGLEATCFISNMSSESIYVEAIIVCLESNGQRWSSNVTDVRGDGEVPAMTTRQGPLAPGASIRVGQFVQLAKRLSQTGSDAPVKKLGLPGKEAAFEVQVIADYASEDLLIGARRRFQVLCRDGHVSLSPETALTHQIRSWRERRKYQQQLRASALGNDQAL